MSSIGYFIPDAEADASSRVIAAYLDAYTQADDLLVDPFCQSAGIVAKALEAGRRVIAVSFHPLDALRTRLALTTISGRDLAAAVTRLADSPKLGIPLREHLQRLYRTACRLCGKTATADFFIWEHGQDLPQQVSYHCPACGDAGIRACDENDGHVLREVQPRGLHYWYILDRIAREQDKGRKFAADLLELYTPRNLYVLANLVLKIEDLFANSMMHDSLRLALLHCLELGSKLNAVPGEPALRHPPRLRPRPRFAERNVCQLFEEATQQLTQQPFASPVTLATSAGDVCLPPSVDEAGARSEPPRAFVGHLAVRQLVPRLPPGSVSLIWTRPPPLSRAHWALSYLWTGWLYGHEESALLWPLVRQRRSAWLWYLQAMRTTLFALQKVLASQGHIVFIGRGKGLAYLETLCLAGAGATLRLQNVVYCPSQPEVATKPFAGLRGDYQLTWTPGTPVPPWPMSTDELTTRVRQVTVAVAEETLQQRAEPAPFVRLHGHIWEALAQRGLLQRIMSIPEQPSPLEFARGQIQAALEEEIHHTFIQLWESEEDAGCLWWLVQPPDTPPLSERVERVTYETLVAAETISAAEFIQQVYQRFPGALTPDNEWIAACLKSYGRQVASRQWTLKEEERQEQRAKAREMSLGSLRSLGHRLSCEVRFASQGFDVQWVQAEREVFGFVLLDSAALSRLLALPPASDPSRIRKIAVVAEARQDLLRLLLARSMWLRKSLGEKAWQFIRDVDLQNWAGQEKVALADLDSFVGLDLLAVQDRTQLSLI